MEACESINPVSTILFVEEYWSYWYALGKGELTIRLEEIVSTFRNKGYVYVGELNPQDLQKVCFEQERFKRITISDAKASEELLDILMGPKVEPRKQYIYDNAVELGFHFD